MEANNILASYAEDSLEQMARQRGLRGGSTGKEALVERLAPGLDDPARIAAAVADLAPVERRLLDRLVELGGSAPTRLLRRELQRAGKVTQPPRPATWDEPAPAEKGSPWQHGSDSFADVVARLGVLGLVFTYGTYTGQPAMDLGVPGQRLYVPSAILAHLPVPPLPIETTDEPPRVLVADPAALLRDVYALVGLVTAEPLNLTARGQIVKKALVRLDGLMTAPEGAADVRSEAELTRLPFLRALAEQVGLVATRARLEPGAEPERFLAQPAGDRRRQLYQAWLASRRWSELFRIAGLQIQMAVGQTDTAPAPLVAARQRIAAELAELPVGQWIRLDHLLDRIRHRAYEFLLPRHAYNFAYTPYRGYEPNVYSGSNDLAWTFSDARGIVDEEDGWDRVEGGLVRTIVTRPLHWLGVLDLGFVAHDAPAIRVRPDGARLLRGEAPETETPPPNVVVQPNFQILAFEPTGEDVLFQLDRLAERVHAGPVAEYRLTRDSVYRAQRAGVETDEIVALLDRVSRTPLPQNVRRTLEEWGAQHNRIVIRRGVGLVHAIDQATLDGLASDPTLGPLLGRRIDPTAALVPFASLRPLYDRLVATDRLPAVTEGRSADAPDLLTIDGGGLIELHQRQPNLYALASVRAFADEDSPSGLEAAPAEFKSAPAELKSAPELEAAHRRLRLTAASLRRAARTGLQPDDILDRLARYHRGDPPPGLPALVRRWAKDWGRGALVEAVLLQVESAQILTDLFADAELAPLLRRLPGADTLALVRFEAVERLRAALDARGMELGDRLAR